MNSSSSGKKLEGFFTGKGFYIVLFLCAAVVGVSAWMMAAGNETMAEDVTNVNRTRLENQRVETVIVTPQVEVNNRLDSNTVEAMAPEISEEDLSETMAEPVEQVWSEEETVDTAASVYAWPVVGELEREYSMDQLSYDVTMRDWRTHNGVDIMAPLGETVNAAHAGTVESIVEDDLYGTVVTVDHGDGTKTVYANLAAVPAVSTGDRVETGSVIGSVGTTSLSEIGQGTHLHFAVTVNGESVDPLNYLPA